MKTRIAAVAHQCNELLKSHDIDESWLLDTDSESNSVGTWFFGDCGGIRTSREIWKMTRAAIAQAEARS